MTDQRPQYGELASPEEQRRAAGLPPIVEMSATPVSVAPAAPLAEPAPGTRRPVDRLATIGLLAYGLVNVIMTGFALLDLPAGMNQAMKMLGIDGEFTNFAQGKLWGTIAAVVLVIGWVVTAVLSLRRLRSGKLTWWLPIVGAICTMAVVYGCLVVPILGDPAFVDYLTKVS